MDSEVVMAAMVVGLIIALKQDIVVTTPDQKSKWCL